MLNCPIEFYIQGHSFTVIASDAHPIEPNHADSIVISAGERYDIVLNADQPVGHYWFYAKGPAASDGLTQSAIITYNGLLTKTTVSLMDRHLCNRQNKDHKDGQ